jgi:ectoine hydroxylase-related dioxygenase (phytanoyl-CoA dioxygenase family)
MRQYWADVNQDGFAVVPELVDREQVASLAQAISKVSKEDGVRRRGGVYAIRNLLEVVPEAALLATCPKVIGLARKLLGSGAFPVKGTLFDKTPDANWLVPWHQDLTIAVKDQVRIDGYGPWTLKAGVVHVQPPVFVLEQMVAIRIHLDDCDERNGVLRVLPRTHRLGRLSADQIASAQAEVAPLNCAVKSGGAVLMKPLLLHASSPALEPTHRRVIHIDFASVALPDGLSWLSCALAPEHL